MKKINILFAALAIGFFLFGACNSGRFVEGKGEIKSKTVPVPSYSKMICDISSDINIHVVPTTNNSVLIKAQNNILELIKLEVKEDELFISYKEDVNIKTSETVVIELNPTTLSSLKILGSSDAVIDGSLVSEKLTCSLMGSGNILCKGATIGKLDAMLAGSGNIKFEQCTAQKARYAINGSGDIGAYDVVAGDADLAITGSGNIEANVVKAIDATITGSGDISYKGGANVVRSAVTGSGKIEKAN
jgi:Putative auto-transporter adhesin, head GIN domain